LSRFETYIHAIRGGEVRGDEAELFELMNAQIVGDEPDVGIDGVFTE
jgi:hypothetical protein